jgi:hypothetical protein
MISWLALRGGAMLAFFIIFDLLSSLQVLEGTVTDFASFCD